MSVAKCAYCSQEVPSPCATNQAAFRCGNFSVENLAQKYREMELRDPISKRYDPGDDIDDDND